MMPNASGRKFLAGCPFCPPGFAATEVDAGRRGFLAGGIATGVASLGLGATAQAQPAARTRIDVHHHYVPPFHAEVMASKRSGGRPPQLRGTATSTAPR